MAKAIDRYKELVDNKEGVPMLLLDGINGYAWFCGARVGFDSDGSGWLARGNIEFDADGNLKVHGRLTAGDGSSIAGMTMDGTALYGNTASFFEPLVYDLNDPESIIQKDFKKNQNFVLKGDIDNGSYNTVILPIPEQIGIYDFSIKIIVQFDSLAKFAIVPFAGTEIRDNNGDIYRFGISSAFPNGGIVMEKGDIVQLYYHDKVYYLENHRH